ncbi:MAG: FecR domain-containing protein [Halobacteriovoraceae bacterium]|nr:FecR domain-containing protein [Halobacteriovoraceae bacterium]MCB9093543.1 FecR domain-containing protein [Halobacteriovoraceae bacterium]
MSLIRYILAILISSAGIFLSYTFLKPEPPGNNNNLNLEAVAKLEYKRNDVEKKAQNAILWSPLEINAELFQGEMLRTGEGAEATVKFIKNGSTIEIDPNTMVVIELDDQKFSLDVLEGSLFVDQANGSGEGQIELKSGNKSVSLSSGQLSFSKSKTGDFEVNVLKGEAKASVGGQSETLGKGASATLAKDIQKQQFNLEIIYPQFSQTVYIQKNEAIPIRWVPFQGDYQISVFYGHERENLKFKTKNEVLASKGETQIKTNPGVLFWKLVGKNSGGELIESPVYKNIVSEIKNPQLISPGAGEDITLPKNEFDLNFSWTHEQKSDSYEIQIAKDPQFKTIVNQGKVNDFYFDLKKAIPSGRYFWRVKAYLPDFDKPVVSEERNFTLSVKSIFPPSLVFPEDNHKIFFNKKTKKVDFRWDRIKGVSEYIFKLERGGKIIERANIQSPQYSYRLNKLGSFQWSVASVGRDGKTSQFSEARNVSALKMPTIVFQNLKEQYFFTGDDYVKFEWKKPLDDFVGDYRVRFWEPGEKEPKNSTTNEPQYHTLPKKEGVYKIKVFALDQYNNLIASSSMQSVSMKMSRALEPPKVLMGEGEKRLKAQDGNIVVRLENLEGAKKYAIRLKNRTGKTIFKKISEAPSFGLKDLLPGVYYIETMSIDRFDRKSELSEAYELYVPDKSSIKAPKIKKIKVQ